MAQAVALLLARGGHADVRDMAYRTPMHYCAAYGWGAEFPSVLTELYLAGANLNAGDQVLLLLSLRYYSTA